MRYSKGLRREHKKIQKRKELVTGRTMICSFDLAKRKHAYHVVDAERNVLARGHVPHSLEGMEQLLKEQGNRMYGYGGVTCVCLFMTGGGFGNGDK